jgi:hypothetical protein
LASKMLCTSVVTHFDGAYSRSSHSPVALTTVYCGQSRPWQNLRRHLFTESVPRGLTQAEFMRQHHSLAGDVELLLCVGICTSGRKPVEAVAEICIGDGVAQPCRTASKQATVPGIGDALTRRQAPPQATHAALERRRRPHARSRLLTDDACCDRALALYVSSVPT